MLPHRLALKRFVCDHQFVLWPSVFPLLQVCEAYSYTYETLPMEFERKIAFRQPAIQEPSALQKEAYRQTDGALSVGNPTYLLVREWAYQCSLPASVLVSISKKHKLFAVDGSFDLNVLVKRLADFSSTLHVLPIHWAPCAVCFLLAASIKFSRLPIKRSSASDKICSMGTR